MSTESMAFYGLCAAEAQEKKRLIREQMVREAELRRIAAVEFREAVAAGTVQNPHRSWNFGGGPLWFLPDKVCGAA